MMKVKATGELGRLLSHNYHAVWHSDDIRIELQLSDGTTKTFTVQQIENYEA